jgi:protein-L-isoaspartate O-methyltransferase
MAIQLEALDLQPGQRVLEIGTGTGYNAALMAHIVGPTGHVVSVDIDCDLVHVATQRLAAAGCEHVQVACGDGLRGYAPHAPYDRLLATGSFRAFSPSWFDQLAAHGRLVGNLVGNLASVFVCLKKEQTIGHGTLLPIGGDKRYMELHQGEFLRPHAPDWAVYDAAVLKEHLIAFDFPALSENTDFLFFLQCLFPRLEHHWRYNQATENVEVYFVAEHFCVTVQARSLNEWLVQERGSGGLWECLYEAYQCWVKSGHPSLDHYHVDVDLSDQYISLGETRWELAQNS